MAKWIIYLLSFDSRAIILNSRPPSRSLCISTKIVSILTLEIWYVLFWQNVSVAIARSYYTSLFFLPRAAGQTSNINYPADCVLLNVWSCSNKKLSLGPVDRHPLLIVKLYNLASSGKLRTESQKSKMINWQYKNVDIELFKRLYRSRYDKIAGLSSSISLLYNKKTHFND